MVVKLDMCSLMREWIGGKITIMHRGGNLLYTNGPFVLTGHMVKHPPYWMAKKRGILLWDIQNKGKSSLTGWNSFVFESATFLCHPVW